MTDRPQVRMAVAVPVSDLRKEPAPRSSRKRQDLLQETQLLLGEDVRILRTRGDWAYVEVLNQLTYLPGEGWKPYPGWMLKDHLVPSLQSPRWNAMVKKATASVCLAEGGEGRPLRLSLGTGVHVLEPQGTGSLRVSLTAGLEGEILRRDIRFTGIKRSSKEQRQRILKSARQFLGEPYLWGGRSSARLGPGCGVDCSGLVTLCYNAVGAYQFPRNAGDQFLKCRRIRREDLKPADLVFLSAKGRPGKIVHVMLYAGSGRVVEAAGKAHGVRSIHLSKRFGLPFRALKDGMEVAGRTLSPHGSRRIGPAGRTLSPHGSRRIGPAGRTVYFGTLL